MLHVQNAAITALSVAFADLDVEQKTPVLDKLVEKLNDVNSSFKDVAIKTLGAVFAYLDSAKKNIVSNELIKKLNCYDCYDAITRLGAIFSYLDTKKRELVLDKLIEKLNNTNTGLYGVRLAAITALNTIFVYLDVNQKTLVLNRLIRKLSDPNRFVKETADITLENIALHNTLSPTEKKLFILNDKNRKVRVAEAISSFTIPYIKLTLSRNIFLKITKSDQNIFATKQKKLTDALLAVNNIFYQNFFNPTETHQELSTIRDKMTDLIRVTQEKRFSTGLFCRAPDDTQSAKQLINYFKLPESLKARILLKEAFGFPDESVIEFEKSLRQLICKIFNSSANSSAVQPHRAYAVNG